MIRSQEHAEAEEEDITNYNGHEIPKMFEEIREYLTCLLGFTKIQLLFIIRKTLILSISSNGDENNYVDKDAEMIARAPIFERGKIAAADETGLDLQATNGP